MKNYLIDIMIILAQTISGLWVLIRLQNTELKINRKKIMFSLIIFTVVMMISNFVIPKHMRSIFTILSLTVISFFIYKNNMIGSIINSLLTVTIVAIIEISFSFMLLLFGLGRAVLLNEIIWKFIINILASIIIIIFISNNLFLKHIIKFKNIIIQRKNLIYYFVIAFLLIYLIVAKNMLFANVSLEAFINLLILFISIILFVIIFISDTKNKHLEENNKQMLSYVTKYEKIITEQGKANHEFKNQLMVIRGYAQMNYPKLIEYLDSITEDANKTHSSYLISQLNKFPDGGIKGLLYYKLSMMDDEKIKYDINVETGVKTNLKSLSTAEYKNITKILGVLLDNAIDASKQTKSKKVVISVSKENSMVIFNIQNTYKGKIDLSKIGTGHTTKGQGHGYGLRLVKDIVDANDMFGVDNFLEDEYFVSKLSIKITKNKKKK